MCFVAVALGISKNFPLILAANRDEVFSRPAEPMTRWIESPSVIAGRDLSAGGTWLGLSQEGRFAALTNCGTAAVSRKSGTLSRGMIVKDFLLGQPDTLRDTETGALADQPGYGGFNLIAGTLAKVSILSNVSSFHRSEHSGVFVLSNCPPNIEWPKTRLGAIRFSEVLSLSDTSGGKEELKNSLFDFLADSTPVTPSTEARGDDALSSTLQRVIFVRGSHYGTRASSVIIVDQHGQAAFYERTFNAHSQLALESEERIQINELRSP